MTEMIQRNDIEIHKYFPQNKFVLDIRDCSNLYQFVEFLVPLTYINSLAALWEYDPSLDSISFNSK